MNRERAEVLPEIITGVIFLFIREGKILVEDRPGDDKDFGDLTLIPGGKVKFRQGESAKEALIREVKEEMGGKVEVGEVIDLGDFYLISKRGKMQHPRAFLIEDFKGDPQNVVPYKGVHRWIKIEDYDKELPLAASKLVVERALKVLNKEGRLEE